MASSKTIFTGGINKLRAFAGDRLDYFRYQELLKNRHKLASPTIANMFNLLQDNIR